MRVPRVLLATGLSGYYDTEIGTVTLLATGLYAYSHTSDLLEACPHTVTLLATRLSAYGDTLLA